MRSLFLVTLASFPALAGQDFSKVEIKVTPVAGKVYMLSGGRGGNIGVSAGDDGILIVDDQFAPLAPKIKAALKGIADKPVRFVLNTHFHGDHTGGNAAMFEAGAELIAQDNVFKRLFAQTTATDDSRIPVSALPAITFSDSLTVHFNGEEIRALRLPSGHTDTDSIIYFTGSKVVHFGDDLFVGRFPFIDLENGGSVKGLIENLDRLQKDLPADVKVIPGHGPLCTMAEVKQFTQMLKDTRAIVAAGMKQGKTLDQLKKENALAKWSSLEWDVIKTGDFTELLFQDLKNNP